MIHVHVGTLYVYIYIHTIFNNIIIGDSMYVHVYQFSFRKLVQGAKLNYMYKGPTKNTTWINSGDCGQKKSMFPPPPVQYNTYTYVAMHNIIIVTTEHTSN